MTPDTIPSFTLNESSSAWQLVTPLNSSNILFIYFIPSIYLLFLDL